MSSSDKSYVSSSAPLDGSILSPATVGTDAPPLNAANLPPLSSSVQASASSNVAANVSNHSTDKSYSKEELSLEELLYGTSPAANAAKHSVYGILGILKVIRMDDNVNIVELGTDLTTLGLNLNSPDCLFPRFSSPWATQFNRDLEFSLPNSYNLLNILPWSPPFPKLEVETLFYIFYNMTGDLLQSCAASELYNRKWKYHRKFKKWFLLSVENEENLQKQWQYFEPSLWMHRFFTGNINAAEFLTEKEIEAIQEDGKEQVRQHQQALSTVHRASAMPTNTVASSANISSSANSNVVTSSAASTVPPGITAPTSSAHAATAQLLRNTLNTISGSAVPHNTSFYISTNESVGATDVVASEPSDS